MNGETQSRPAGARSLSRRTMAKGAVWTTPVLLAGSIAAPAAASVAPGLQGWVEVAKTCSQSRVSLTINGIGSYPDRGLWVYNARPSQLSNAFITFYYPTTLGTIAWSTASGNSNWSVPAVDSSATAITGFTAYTTRYSGTWTYHPTGLDAPYTTADGQPNFSGTAPNSTSCSAAISLYARRTVTVNGQTISFLRGPVTLGAPQLF